MNSPNTRIPTVDVLPRWDLSAFYGGIDDPAIEKTLLEMEQRAVSFQKTWRGAVTATTTPEQLLEALKEYEVILQEAQKPMHYAHLISAVDSANSQHGALLQKTQARYLDVYRHLIFFELELVALSSGALTRLRESEALSNYYHFLLMLEKTKPHRLNEREERIMNDLALTGSAAFTRLFDEELSQKKFQIVLGEKMEEGTEEQVLNLLYDPSREKRRAGARALSEGLRADLRRLTFIFNMLAEDKRIRDFYTKFQTPEAARHLANEVSQEMVDIMSEAVRGGYSIVADFYRTKKELLGLETLYDYDRYAPLAESEHTYSFEEAQDMVLSAYAAFSPMMRERAEAFFASRWIDAPVSFGKRGGAFCSFGTPDTHPVVFLNYGGTIKHVLTLAHELGHGVHASLMRRQTMLNFETPLTIAETASVFGELLVFDYMRARVSGEEKRALYAMKLEEIFATVFRQHAMYAFEQDFHAARRQKGERTADEISDLWIQRQQEMFGDSVTLTDDYRIWWSYIPHFLHTPFYVYAYVFGELLVLALYDMYKKTEDKEDFARRYLQLLKAGGSQTPEALLQPFGIDLGDKEFWQRGLRVITELVEDMKHI